MTVKRRQNAGECAPPFLLVNTVFNLNSVSLRIVYKHTLPFEIMELSLFMARVCIGISPGGWGLNGPSLTLLNYYRKTSHIQFADLCHT